mmetsp:Transcript_34512/g.62583  ORF Transcript_34512/g.62583 Transcript_34512/m.62583 type:complete len:108 (+) Transcript_34512:2390-2713(+)
MSAKCFKELMMLRAVVESKPEVGSSSMRNEGLETSSRPMLTRFFWPPLMPLSSESPTTVCCTWVSCMTLRTSSTMFSTSFELKSGFPSRAEYQRFSRTVNFSWTMSS